MDEIEKTQQQVTEAMGQTNQPEIRLEPVHITVTHGDPNTPIENRGFSSSLWGLTPEQIKGEFSIRLNDLLKTCERFQAENMEKLKNSNNS